MAIDFLMERFCADPGKTALIFQETAYTYGWLFAEIRRLRALLAEKLKPGNVVVLEGDYSAPAVAYLLALIDLRCIVAPIALRQASAREDGRQTAQARYVLHADSGELIDAGPQDSHPLYDQLRGAGAAGLVLFSSGSTGKSKAVVHDFGRLLAKFTRRRHDLVTLAFLLFDHIGGLDTLFYCLSNTSTIVVPPSRAPRMVCHAIQSHKVQVLPVSPTFLNLLMLSDAYQGFDLSSLQCITYGSEVMPAVTLKRCREIFPNVRFLQKYGTTEVGALRSQSKDSDSLFVRLGGEGYQTRVVEGMLQIKAESSMLGYLNAPSPFTEDGWFITGDAVEVDGEFIHILGRKSEIINVGGQKVHPAEVEAVIQEMPEVAEVAVYGQANPIMGNIVCARVTPAGRIDASTLILRIKTHCRQKLAAHQTPVRIILVEAVQHNERFKKVRSSHAGAA